MFKGCKLQILSYLKLGLVVVIVAIMTLTRVSHDSSEVSISAVELSSYISLVVLKYLSAKDVFVVHKLGMLVA